MKALVINSGSSSIKISFFEDDKLIKHNVIQEIKNHHKSLEIFFKNIDIKQFDFISHRVVHGGEKFIKPLLIDKNNLNELKALNYLAPLHNPANIEAIEYIFKKYPKIPQVAVFDTAFHSNIPEFAKLLSTSFVS